MGVLMSIPYEFSDASITDVKELNSSFAVGKLKVMYLGDNRNGTYFSEDAVRGALSSLKNVPIVCHYDGESKEIGGHDIEVVKDDDGTFRFKNLTEPCGVVPEHAQFLFEDCEDEDGEIHTYLVIDGVILWKRQEAYRHIRNELDGKAKHSMEINVRECSKTSDGVFDVKDFEFTALCLLETANPCFKGSELELYSADNFKCLMKQMLAELRETLTSVNSANPNTDTNNQNYSTKEGEETLEEKLKLATEYGIDVNSLDFSLDDFKPEELKEKFEAMRYALVEERLKEIRRVLRDLETHEVQICDEIVAVPKYCYADCDFDAGEVYCWDDEDWLLYGFAFTVNGDVITIDVESKKRKKFAIVDFDNGDQEEQESPVAQVVERLDGIEQKFEVLAGKYSEALSSISEAESKLEGLRKFKADTEMAFAEAKRNELFAKFEDLSENESFIELRENCEKYSLEELEEKCYAIRGRSGSTMKFSTKENMPKLKVEKREPAYDEPYGGIMAKYSTGTN